MYFVGRKAPSQKGTPIRRGWPESGDLVEGDASCEQWRTRDRLARKPSGAGPGRMESFGAATAWCELRLRRRLSSGHLQPNRSARPTRPRWGSSALGCGVFGWLLCRALRLTSIGTIGTMIRDESEFNGPELATGRWRPACGSLQAAPDRRRVAVSPVLIQIRALGGRNRPLFLGGAPSIHPAVFPRVSGSVVPGDARQLVSASFKQTARCSRRAPPVPHECVGCLAP